MGAMAHIAQDDNFDMFFVQTVGEREDCPQTTIEDPDFPALLTAFPFSHCSIDFPQPGPIKADSYTDQELDGYLGRDPHNLFEYFPTSVTVRNDVEDTFLMDLLSDPGLLGVEAYSLDTLLTKQWGFVRLKTSSEGNLFNLWRCRDQPDEGKMCDDLNPSFCPESCMEDDNCRAFDNLFNGCNEVVTKLCSHDSDCGEYGPCQHYEPVYRDPYYFMCNWAIDGDHWFTEGGGTDESAQLIASMIERAWSIMRQGRSPGFFETGRWPDKRICVGNRPAPNCLLEQTIQVTGTVLPGESEPLSGTLSQRTLPSYINEIQVGRSGYFRFVLKNAATTLGIGCGDNRTFDLSLDAASDEERATIKAFTDTVFKAYIEQHQIQVRVDLNDCSSNGGFLTKDIRFPGPEAPVANAGPDQILECTGGPIPCAYVTLDGSGSSDPNGDPLTFNWTAPDIVFDDPTSVMPTAVFFIGTTEATLEVSDGQQGTDDDTVAVTVQDTTPPSLAAPGDITVDCAGPSGAWVDLGDAVANDLCCPDAEVWNDAPQKFPIGTTIVTWTATDCAENSSTATQTVTVVDTTEH